MNWLPRWDANAHAWHHIEFGLYVLIALLFLYRPPRRSSNAVEAIKGVFEAHWGDSIGLYLLHLGIGLTILAGVWPNMTQVGQVGFALVTASMAVLKLKAPPEAAPANGNGTPPVSPTSAIPPAAVPTPAVPSPPAPAPPPAGWQGKP